MLLFKRILILLSVLLFGSAIYLIIVDPTLDINIPESTINDGIQSKMPFVKDIVIDLPLLEPKNGTITANQAIISLISNHDFDNPDENGFINIKGNIDILLDDSKGNGDFDVTGQIKYEDGDFFVRDSVLNSINIISLELSEKDQKLLDKSKNVVAAAKDLKKKTFAFLNKHKLIKDKKTSESKANSFLTKAKKKLSDKARTFIINKIESTPVYSLKQKDFKQSLAAMALQKIVVSDQNFMAQLSGGKIVKKFLLYIILAFSVVLFLIGGFMNINNNKRSNGSSGGSGGGFLDGVEFAFDLTF
jgi:hypothetical protein